MEPVTEATIDSREFHALFKATRDFDRKLYAGLRRELRKAGDPIVDDIRREIGNIPSSGRHSTGVRAALAAGTKVSILAASQKTAGIRITTSPNKLPAGKRSLAKAMNKARWRHPVFADAGSMRSTWWWSEQAGRPYFGKAIYDNREQVRTAVVDAFNKAAADLPGYHD